MSAAKEEALELIRQMPDGAATEEILHELIFKVQVERGLQDVAEGRTISHAEVKERLRAGRASAGP